MKDFAVVGAGLAGAAVAWRLVSRGHQVSILERATPGHQGGSSHGSARIFRYAYADPLYTELVVRAKVGWDQLEAQSGRQLISPTGAIDHGRDQPLRAMTASLERADVEHELLSPRQASERWPQLTFETDALWHPGAGVLDAIGTVETLINLAIATGQAELRTDWPVATVTPIRGGYELTGPAGAVVRARGVVVAAGGWLPDVLASLPLPRELRDAFPPLTVQQEQVAHFPYREPDDTPWPSFIYKSPQIRTYGLPGGRDGGFRGQKVAQFGGGKVISSAAVQDGVIDLQQRDRLIDFAQRHLPGVVPEPYAEATCLFTSTPTTDFVFDRFDGITIVSPCSGHGAKFAPLIGELGADLALGSGEVPEQFRVLAHSLAGARP